MLSRGDFTKVETIKLTSATINAIGRYGNPGTRYGLARSGRLKRSTITDEAASA